MTTPFVNFPVPTTPLSLTNVLATGSTVTRSLGDRFARWFFVQDYGAVGDGIADDTAAILSALAAAAANGAGVGIVQLMSKHKFSSVINPPQGVLLNGLGYGDFQGNPDGASRTLLSWFGGATDGVITLGANGAGGSWVGGGISNFTIDCRDTARSGVKIIDIGQFYVGQVNVLNPTVTAWWLTNTPGVLTCFGTFDLASAVCTSGGGGNNASCMRFEGIQPGGGGVTLCRFLKFRGQHRNGQGIEIVRTGDGMYWEAPDLFRPGGLTSYSIYNNLTDTVNETAGGWYITQPLLSSGVHVTTPGGAGNWVLEGGNDTDVTSGLPPNISGPGAGDVSYTGAGGSRNGYAQITQAIYLDKADHETCRFTRWDSANSVLQTTNGNYLTTVSGAGATIINGGQNTGAIEQNTGGTIGNISAWRVDPASGVTVDLSPQLLVKYAPLDTANAVHRVGLFGDFNDPPTDGFYIESDTSQNANFRLICAKAGVRTVVIGTVSCDQFQQWRIQTDGNGTSVQFWRRAPTFIGWSLEANISTNISTAKLAFGTWSKTRANAGVRIHMYDWKFAHHIP